MLKTLSDTIENQNLLKEGAVLPPIYNTIAETLKQHS